MNKRSLILFCLFLVPQFVYAADPTDATAVLLDASRSIPSGDFQTAKSAIHAIIDTSNPSDVLFVYSFGGKLNPIDPEELPTLKPTGSSTSIYDSAHDAARILAGTAATRKTLIIFSDGYDTRSATTLEDLVSYANKESISIHAIGFAKFDRKVMERLPRLTGGKFFAVDEAELAGKIRAAILSDVQRPAESAGTEQNVVKQEPPSLPAPADAAVVIPTERKPSFPYLWMVMAGVMLGFVAFLVIRKTRKPAVRIDSDVAEKAIIFPPAAPSEPESAQEIGTAAEDPSFPGWFDKKELTQEILTGTIVLVDTASLVVQKGPNVGQVFLIPPQSGASLGRSRVNEIRIDDASVSAQHCRIVQENGKVVLYDLGSTNGTFLNEAKVTKAVLQEGDILKVGQTQFLYRIEQARR